MRSSHSPTGSSSVTARARSSRRTRRRSGCSARTELLRLKEEFLLDVAHELRTPIAALTASLDLVHQDAISMPRKELRTMVGTLRRSALRLEHLVDNLLDAGSIEAGTFEVRAVPASIKAILEDSLLFMRSILDSQGQN